MGWVVNTTSRPLYPQKKEPVPIVQEISWARRPVWTAAEILTPTGIQTPNQPARGVVAIPTTLSQPT